MYNFDEIQRLDISINDEVLIKKAAEIIPKVIKSRKLINYYDGLKDLVNKKMNRG